MKAEPSDMRYQAQPSNEESVNVQLDILRSQTRLLLDFKLIAVRRYEYAIKSINDIGVELGGWMKQQSKRKQFQYSYSSISNV